MNRLEELGVLDKIINAALDTATDTQDPALPVVQVVLKGAELRVVAKHLVRLMARDRQKAEQSRRHKIAKCLTKATR